MSQFLEKKAYKIRSNDVSSVVYVNQRNVYLDQHLLRNYDYVLFQSVKNQKDLNVEKVIRSSYLKKLGEVYKVSKIKEAREMCWSRGGDIPQNHLYMTFVQQKLGRFQYSWTRERNLKTLFQENSLKIFCRWIYTRECFEKSMKYSERSGVTDSGIFEVHGGPFELLRNQSVPQLDLRSSSQYFDHYSHFHKIGARLSTSLMDSNKLNGEEFEKHLRFHFDDRSYDELKFSYENDLLTKADVGARCLYER